MIYGKLPVVFLSVIASEKSGSTNSAIATYILEHMDEVKDLGIKEMAERCHVGLGSVSRFCKDVGLRDFVELKELLKSTELNFEVHSQENDKESGAAAYGARVTRSINMVTKTISRQKLAALCRDLKAYEKVAAFGLLKAECAAVSLQGDLLMLGKQVYTNVSYDQQIEYIEQAGRDCLILIFSYTGSYFEYHSEGFFRGRDKKDWPRIWMISGRQKEVPEYGARVLDFQSPQDQAGHPYQLLYAAGLIAQEYARNFSTQWGAKE